MIEECQDETGTGTEFYGVEFNGREVIRTPLNAVADLGRGLVYGTVCAGGDVQFTSRTSRGYPPTITFLSHIVAEGGTGFLMRNEIDDRVPVGSTSLVTVDPRTGEMLEAFSSGHWRSTTCTDSALYESQYFVERHINNDQWLDDGTLLLTTYPPFPERERNPHYSQHVLRFDPRLNEISEFAEVVRPAGVGTYIASIDQNYHVIIGSDSYYTVSNGGDVISNISFSSSQLFEHCEYYVVGELLLCEHFGQQYAALMESGRQSTLSVIDELGFLGDSRHLQFEAGLLAVIGGQQAALLSLRNMRDR